MTPLLSILTWTLGVASTALLTTVILTWPKKE